MPHMHNHLSYTYYRKWGSRTIIVSLHETKCACTLILFSTNFQMRQLEKDGNQVSAERQIKIEYTFVNNMSHVYNIYRGFCLLE